MFVKHLPDIKNQDKKSSLAIKKKVGKKVQLKKKTSMEVSRNAVHRTQNVNLIPRPIQYQLQSLPTSPKLAQQR